MSVLPFGTYMVTLPWIGRGQDPHPNQHYSMLYDDDTEDNNPAFHEPNDENFWGSIYLPLTYNQCIGETEIAGAESGPSLAAPLPPGIGLVPKRPK